MGRVTSHLEYDKYGTNVYTRTATYNANSQITSDHVAAAGTTSDTTYDYGTAGDLMALLRQLN